MGGVTFALVESVATLIQIVDLTLTAFQSNLSPFQLGYPHHFVSWYEFLARQSATVLESQYYYEATYST